MNWIIGGNETPINAYPWMAMLSYRPGNRYPTSTSVILKLPSSGSVMEANLNYGIPLALKFQINIYI